MTSISSSSKSAKTELPTNKEWCALKDNLKEVWKLLNRQDDETNFFALYQLIEKAKAGKLKESFLTKSFALFTSILGPISFNFEMHRSQIFSQQYSIDKKIAECTERFFSPLLTLHKFTSHYISLIQSSGAVTFDGQLGTIRVPKASSNTIHYLQDRSAHLYPFFSGYPQTLFTGQIYSYIQLPIFTAFETELLERAVIIGPGDQIVQDSGILFVCASKDEVAVSLTYGKDSATPFSISFTIVNGHLNKGSADLRTKLVNELIPENIRASGANTFIPYPSDPVEKILIEITILEQLMEGCENPILKEQAADEIREIEKELINHYQKEYEEKIRQEQTERKQLVITGEINQIMKSSSSSKSKKKKVHESTLKNVATEPQTEKRINTLTSAEEILNHARSKLGDEKQRIKKHKFINFISAVKKICSQTEFEGLITQSGSHLTLHTEEKEPLTLVVPHKNDRTTPGKILNRFVNRLQELIKCQK